MPSKPVEDWVEDEVEEFEIVTCEDLAVLEDMVDSTNPCDASVAKALLAIVNYLSERQDAKDS